MNNEQSTTQARRVAREVGGIFVDGYAVRLLSDLVHEFNATSYLNDEGRAALGARLALHIESLLTSEPPLPRDVE